MVGTCDMMLAGGCSVKLSTAPPAVTVSCVCCGHVCKKKNNKKKNTPDKYSHKTTTPHLSPVAASAPVCLFIRASALDEAA